MARPGKGPQPARGRSSALIVAENDPKNVSPSFGTRPTWAPAKPRLEPARLVFAWFAVTFALLLGAWIVPGADVTDFWGALAAALVIAILNAVLPPLVAALRLPLTLVLGFVLVLLLDALMLLAADALTNGGFTMDSFWSALGVGGGLGRGRDARRALRSNDDDTYAFRVTQRIARRSGEQTLTDAPGIVFLEIDGLALPVLRHAMRDGSAPTMARWLVKGGVPRRRVGDRSLSSQTVGSQGHYFAADPTMTCPAFRWVEKETAILRAC